MIFRCVNVDIKADGFTSRTYPNGENISEGGNAGKGLRNWTHSVDLSSVLTCFGAHPSLIRTVPGPNWPVLETKET